MSMIPEFKLREDTRWRARVVRTKLQLRKHVLKSSGKYPGLLSKESLQLRDSP
jgi:hypothetical protein